jgi:hypothetical protein
LKTIMAPILPHTPVPTHRTQKLHEYLSYDHSGAIGTWTKSELPAGQPLRESAPLFKKLDESVIEEKYARLEP